MDAGLYSVFLVTTVMLILVPGPAAITVATQGASYGANRALFGIMGVASADVIYFALSATGIASLIIASNLLFSIVKWFGVAYLLYLGFGAFFSKSGVLRIESNPVQVRASGLFYQGLVVQLANPKALLYFSALLPQFVDSGKPVFAQIFIMGASCLVADLMVYSVFSHLGNILAKRKPKKWMVDLINKAAGLTLISTGIRMASLQYSRLP